MSALEKPAAPTLESLLAQGGIWRGNGLGVAPLPGVGSRFKALDAVLPGNGWPVGAISEIFPEQEGIGEVSLVLPALAGLCEDNRAIAWVVPALAGGATRGGSGRHSGRPARPQVARMPCAPALAAAGLDLSKLLLIEPRSTQETIWALRQVIAARAFGAVVGWLGVVDAHSLRRLQIAAEGSPTVVLLFRPAHLAQQASPAALKLHLAARREGLAVSVIKRRGCPLDAPIILPVGDMRSPARFKLPPVFATPWSAHAMDRDSSTRPAAAGVPPC